jgi:hypothetical protein
VLTTTEPAIFPSSFLDAATVWEVSAGQIEEIAQK